MTRLFCWSCLGDGGEGDLSAATLPLRSNSRERGRIGPPCLRHTRMNVRVLLVPVPLLPKNFLFSVPLTPYPCWHDYFLLSLLPPQENHSSSCEMEMQFLLRPGVFRDPDFVVAIRTVRPFCLFFTGAVADRESKRGEPRPKLQIIQAQELKLLLSCIIIV